MQIHLLTFGSVCPGIVVQFAPEFSEKVTYKRLNIHFKELRSYITKLEKHNHIDKPIKANSEKAYKAFNDIVADL